MAEQAGRWRLERLQPNGVADWPPATPAPVLAEAASPELLGERLPAPLVAIAAFTGTVRRLPLRFGETEGRLDVLEGAIRGVATEQPACRVQFSGPAILLAGFAAELGGDVDIRVPGAGLGADAVSVARGVAPAPRHLGAPTVPPGCTVGQAMCIVTAHLADVILYWAPRAPIGTVPEPVHQMRVAVRRLRAALHLYRDVAAGSVLAELEDALKNLAARLGSARDWDVFLSGAGDDVRQAFPDDARVAGLLTAASRKRAAAYAALGTYLGGEDWRRLALRLALLPTAEPWRDPMDAEQAAQLAAPSEDHAAATLARLQGRVLKAGADFATLSPTALHGVRKRAKALRYATEFFTSLFPAKRVRRYLEKLEDLQADLGTVNDGHVAAHLMGQLGQSADRAFAAGAVQGYVAALSGKAATRATKSWTKFARQENFWH